MLAADVTARSSSEGSGPNEGLPEESSIRGLFADFNSAEMS
jgi:hypothetical protein